MKRLITLALMLSLASCAQDPEIVTATQQLVMMPNPDLFECPEVTTFPDWRSLTDIETALLLEKLFKNNEQCRYNIQAIKKFLEDAKNVTETKSL